MNSPLPCAAELAALACFELDGIRCRVVRVDEVLPTHLPRQGSARIQQCFVPDEIAHFSLWGHRYAIVPQWEVVQANGGNGGNGGEGAHSLHTLLTNCELQIVQLICHGLLTKQVSDRLHISEFTVRSYLKTIYCKLGVRSRGAMVYTYAQAFARSQRGPTAADL